MMASVKTMAEPLYLLTVADLLNIIVKRLKHGMLALIIADERHTGDDRALPMRVEKSRMSSVIISKLRSQVFSQQFKTVNIYYGDKALEDLIKELSSRGSSMCIGFILEGSTEIQCKFLGEQGQWEMLVEALEEKIKENPAVFGEIT
jgi:hypothetical protein